MKQIEKATILKLNDNMLTEDMPIASITVKYLDRSSNIIGGYTGNDAIKFLNNLMIILGIKDKNELVGKNISVCTEFYRTLAIGNELKEKWIDVNDIENIIDGDIVQYLEQKAQKNIKDRGFDR